MAPRRSLYLGLLLSWGAAHLVADLGCIMGCGGRPLKPVSRECGTLSCTTTRASGNLGFPPGPSGHQVTRPPLSAKWLCDNYQGRAAGAQRQPALHLAACAVSCSTSLLNPLGYLERIIHRLCCRSFSACHHYHLQTCHSHLRAPLFPTMPLAIHCTMLFPNAYIGSSLEYFQVV